MTYFNRTPINARDLIAGEINKTEFLEPAKRDKGEFGELIVRQIETLERSEGPQSAFAAVSVPVAVSVASEGL